MYESHTHVCYKEFRDYLDSKVAGASGVLSKMTGVEYEKSSEAGKQWPKGSTLPQHFEPVQDILASIEASKIDQDKSAPRLTPSQRAAARMQKDTATETPAVTHVDEAPAPVAEKAVEPVVAVTEAKPTDAPAPPAAKEAVETAIVETKAVVETPPKKTLLATVPPANADIQDAKTKLARVFGKPSEESGSPFTKKTAVIDKSVYRKLTGAKKSKDEDGGARADRALSEVQALRRDLENQAQWEGVRMQKALFAQLLEDKKMAAKEAAELSRKHADALEKVKADAVANMEKVLALRTHHIETRAAAQRDRELEEMLATRQHELRTELEIELFERERAAASERESQFNEASARVDALVARFDDLVEHNRLAREAAQTSAAAFAVCAAIATDRPFAVQLDAVAEKTQLAAAVAQSIPRYASEHGVRTLPQLQSAFATTAQRALGAALVPAENAGSIWAQFLGAVVSRLKIRLFDAAAASADFDTPTSDEDRIRQAQAYVEAGLLTKAVHVLDDVETPLSATILSDWLMDAKARCAADLASGVLFADACIAQVALATTPPTHPAAA